MNFNLPINFIDEKLNIFDNDASDYFFFYGFQTQNCQITSTWTFIVSCLY